MERLTQAMARSRLDPLGLIGLLALILVWWIVTHLQWVSPMFLPPPGKVAATIAQDFFSSPYLANYHLGNGGLLSSLAYTVSNVLIALGLRLRGRDNPGPDDSSSAVSAGSA